MSITINKGRSTMALYSRARDFVLKTSSNDSFSFETGAYRSGVLKYVGSGSRGAIARYYQKNMPSSLYGWTEGKHMSAGREEVLTFHKERDVCTVRILEQGGETHITIQMSSKQ